VKQPSAAGGWKAIWYTLKKARQAGGVVRTFNALKSRNACKTCALGMGGQMGGMVNEAGHFPEVCKKSVQAMAADMQGGLSPEYFERFDFARLERMAPRELEASGRIVQPLYAGPDDSTYRPIPWDEAIDRVVDSMRETPPDESFFYFSGRSSNEAGFLLQLVARLYGTNNVNNCSYFCHQASGVGLASVTGSGTATIRLEDVTRCDLLVLIGGNPASNHPRFMRALMDLKRAGGRVVVINPMRELGLERFKVPSDIRSLLLGTSIADEYAQPHIGGDIALLTGIAKHLLEISAIDQEFIVGSTTGFDAFGETVEDRSWDEIVRCSGVSLEQIRRIAEMYRDSSRTVFAWTMGITHHTHGVENVQMIANVAMLRGMLGGPGKGLLPLRGHSNVQGIGSVGVTPALKDQVVAKLRDELGVVLPEKPGLDTLECVEASSRGAMRLAWHLGGNLYGSCPDSRMASTALRSIETTVFLSTTLNTGHIHGRGQYSIILPVLARDEEPQATTQESMFNFVRLSDGGAPRLGGPRSEVRVIASIARRVLPANCPLDLRLMEEHQTIRQAIAKVIPGYAPVGTIDSTKREFHIEGRTFHSPKFNTDDGRARFHCIDLPGRDHEPDALTLMTIRSEGQFNTVVYEDEDVYRGQERRDVILMNQADIDAMGLATNDTVTVSSEIGEVGGIVVRAFDIRAGNAAMYYPEANTLVPGHADPVARTPAFKNVQVHLKRELTVRGAR
jgi:molybdopterin-dependent oxidoreductase alpha subunit